MNQIDVQYHSTAFGELILGSFDGQLCLCDWRHRRMREAVDTRLQRGLSAVYWENDNEVLAQTRHQLTEYFGGSRRGFTIPLLFVGTDFQKSVWQTLLNVDYGSTASYLQLSELLGNKDAIRAVASANGANAISILVPCHRIIGSKGELVGYAGGLAAKQKLLTLENPRFGQSPGGQMTLGF
jgi:methylated-DNA-[protein]-cysteine S-methyltransferase